jgi:ATP-dependent Clp protease protease subunit
MEKKVSALYEIDKIDTTEERIRTICMYSEVCEDVTLDNLKEQAGDITEIDILCLKIASPGGSVSEGLKIMTWLDTLSAMGIKVVTVVVANSYSIASLIMLAANYRVISTHGKVMVHNPMVCELKYANADELEKNASALRMLEQIMYEMYTCFTGMEQEVIKELMDNETYLDPQQALEYGFVDEIMEVEKVPYVEAISNQKKELNMGKTLNILNKVIGKINNSEFINQVYYAMDGSEINIMQKSPSAYSVGDKTDVENGEFTIADGSKLIIANSVISDISKEVEAKAVEVKEEVEAEAVEAKVEAVEAVEAVEKVEVKAEAVEAVEEASEEVSEEVKVEAKEVEAVAEAVEEVKEEVEVVAGEFNEGAAPKDIEAGGDKYKAYKEEMSGALSSIKEMVENISNRVVALEEMGKANAGKIEYNEKMLELSANAISDISESTASNFAPSAIKAEKSESGLSIFQKAKREAGL